MANCPICNGEFRAQTLDGVTVATCANCDGLWLSHGDLDRLTGLKIEEEFDSWMDEPTECRYCQTPLGFGANCVRCGKPPTIGCPLGHGTMNAALVDVHGREFEIDHCPSCRGVWIDGHEVKNLDTQAPRQVRQIQRLEQVSGIPRNSYKHDRTNSFLSAIGDELTRGPGMGMMGFQGSFAPQPWNWGRSEPLSLIFFFLLIAGALAALYYFSGGALVVF